MLVVAGYSLSRLLERVVQYVSTSPTIRPPEQVHISPHAGHVSQNGSLLMNGERQLRDPPLSRDRRAFLRCDGGLSYRVRRTPSVLLQEH